MKKIESFLKKYRWVIAILLIVLLKIKVYISSIVGRATYNSIIGLAILSLASYMLVSLTKDIKQLRSTNQRYSKTSLIFDLLIILIIICSYIFLFFD
ncbi:hypothetical protein [[Clostridium] dakarense]|uniref:hypothetical protein n=1 Tax=Faecalimicrobium dakarense TaxID=1301100 RepID=UPI0011CB3F1B|nr:hypothetical protein [[Clostridium] dakarense]